MNYAQATEYIDNLTLFGIKLGLEQPKRLFELANLDYSKLRFIHLAGTNGKGSCGAMLQQALQSTGCKVGFYTSPHLISVRERFRINGQAISEEEFALSTENISLAVAKLKEEGGSATYFEVVTAIALDWFIRSEVEFVVWECGMGGRLDATNVVTPVASVITNVACDHTQYLGDTLAKIAFEKAGIIKPNVPVFAGQMASEAFEVIKSRAQELNAKFIPSNSEQSLEWSCLRDGTQHSRVGDVAVVLPLVGRMQRRNFMLVLAVLEEVCQSFELDFSQAIAGIAQTRWPGRVQQVLPNLWIDGGHNPDGAAATVEALKELMPNERICIVFGAFKDKDVEGELKILDEIASEFIFVPVGNDFRPEHSPNELCELSLVKAKSSTSTSVNEAISLALGRGCKVLATGSLYLIANVLTKEVAAEAVLNI